MTRWQPIGALLLISFGALLLLPQALDSWLATSVALVLMAAAAVWGWARGQWLSLLLVSTFVMVADLFGLVRSQPNSLWFVMVILWLGGTWLVGQVGSTPRPAFYRALASFLLLELFLTLQLWPINILSKTVIAVSFGFLLWQELTRVVPLQQRLRDSVLPFFLIITLMTLTGQWLTF